MKYRTEWNLGLLYKNDHDPQIEKDILSIEKACAALEKKYKSKDFTNSSTTLLQALKDYEIFSEIVSTSKAWWYFALRSDLNSDDKKAGAAATRIEQRLNLATNKAVFFNLVIGKIDSAKQKQYLNDKKLEPFKYKLKTIFDQAKYNLTEQEEQLTDLLSQTSYTMWVDGQERLLSQQVITYKGIELPIAKAISILSDESKKGRVELNKKINDILKRNSYFAEAEINAIYNFKKIMDERRGYQKPYSSTVLWYENDEKTIESLADTITKKFHISNRFYTLHAKLLKEKKITVAERSTKIGEIKKKFDFETAVELTKKAFTKVDPLYAELLTRYLQNGQIDVFPKKGKKGGAYCWGTGKLPTFVLLNHTDNVRSVETLAHEMGHAIHTEFSKQQPHRYRKYSTATAEVASTFFEQLVIDELEQYLSESEKVVLLHNKILGDIATIFRQIAFFNFELDLHYEIRRKGQVDAKTIALLMQKHLQSYLGKSVDVTVEDGYFFVYLSHIRRFFYVYSYAYGQLVSRALYEKWKTDKSYSAKIEQFLSAGRSMSPKDIFESVGITTNAAFFTAGLKSIENDIDKLERLSKKQKLI